MTLPRDAPIHQKGLNLFTRIEAYNTIADHFEEDFLACGYRAHYRTAELVNEFCNKDAVEILDVACGTGLVGVALNAFEFYNIDGFDPAAKMVYIAKEHNVYRKVRCHGLLPRKLDVPDCTYDVVTIGGYPNSPDTISDGLTELLRVIKIGGYVILTTRNMFYDNDGFKLHLRSRLRILEEKGKLKTVVEDVFPDYLHDVEGVRIMFQRLI